MGLKTAALCTFSLFLIGLNAVSANDGIAAQPDAKALSACVSAIREESPTAVAPTAQELIKRTSRAGHRYEYWINTVYVNDSGVTSKTRAYCHVRSNGEVLKLHLSAGLWDKRVRRPLLADN